MPASATGVRYDPVITLAGAAAEQTYQALVAEKSSEQMARSTTIPESPGHGRLLYQDGALPAWTMRYLRSGEMSETDSRRKNFQ